MHTRARLNLPPPPVPTEGSISPALDAYVRRFSEIPVLVIDYHGLYLLRRKRNLLDPRTS